MQSTNIKAYDEFWRLYKSIPEFRNLVERGFESEKVRFFDDREWNLIASQNYIAPVADVSSFTEMFERGYNIGDCVGMSWQLSYSYNDVDVVAGILPILKGSKNAEVEGGHRWLENAKEIIDTTLMLVISKDLKSDFGYIEEQRLTAFQLCKNTLYQARKEFVNDRSLKK